MCSLVNLKVLNTNLTAFTAKVYFYLACPFLKMEKRYLDFRKKYPDCAHLWVKYFICNAFFRAPRRKKLQNFSLWDLSFVCSR